MPSRFLGFDVKIDPRTGPSASAPMGFVRVPGAVLHVRDVTDEDLATGAGAIALDDIVADGDGVVASGTLDVAVGRTIRFTWYRALDGKSGVIERVTTEIP